jgi:hypothetical protein
MMHSPFFVHMMLPLVVLLILLLGRRHAWFGLLVVIILLTVTAMFGCMPQPEQGPPVIDVTTLVEPTPQPPVTQPLPVPGPAVDAGRFRVWVPRVTSPQGDVVEGHWAVISLAEPAVQSIEPDKPLPRPPKTLFPKAQTAPVNRAPVMPTTPMPPPVSSLPPGGPPAGLGLQPYAPPGRFSPWQGGQ